MIIGVALYFTLAWGYEGLHTISSPSYGLDDVWRSQFVFAIGGLFGLGPIGLIKLAAFFGTLKLAVASICAVHVLDRLRVFIGGKPDSEIAGRCSTPACRLSLFLLWRLTRQLLLPSMPVHSAVVYLK